MTRERQEFYQYLKLLDLIFCHTSYETKFLDLHEGEIYFEAVTKLRSLTDKFKKEYEGMIKNEEKQHSAESI